ncbi:hypothetical protein SETIT_7G050900v2 [Setaria italica]|uniref:Uncharacterized protein n=1 Tax=Setaria italica TaxID=4555 RepID=A0A368RS97_SETIT|nr:hypothetical protein SETIT_7G050900v2 [Setaria italica]
MEIELELPPRAPSPVASRRRRCSPTRCCRDPAPPRAPSRSAASSRPPSPAARALWLWTLTVATPPWRPITGQDSSLPDIAISPTAWVAAPLPPPTRGLRAARIRCSEGSQRQ